MARSNLQITAASPDPALLDLPVGRPARGVARRRPRRPAPRHLAAHRALRQACPAASSRSRRSARPSPTASTSCCASSAASTCPASSPSGSSPGAQGARRRAARGRAHHRAPAVLAALPRAVQPDAAARHRDPAHRRPRGAPGAPAPRRLLLGRRVAVQHAVPPRRRDVRRLPRRRRDRRPARPAHRRPARRTTSRSPASTSSASSWTCRPASSSTRTSTPSRSATPLVERYDGAVDRAHRRGVVRRRGPLAGRRPHRAAQRPRASTSASSTSRPTSTARRCSIQPKVVDAGHHSRRLMRLTGPRRPGEPGPAPAQRPRRVPRGDGPAERRGVSSSRTTGSPASSSPPSAPSRASCARKLEPAQVFHELLDHRWFISQRAEPRRPDARGRASYVENVLRTAPTSGDPRPRPESADPHAPIVDPRSRRTERRDPTGSVGPSRRRSREPTRPVPGPGTRGGRARRQAAALPCATS